MVSIAEKELRRDSQHFREGTEREMVRIAERKLRRG
jgi:hypothetical protein